MASNLTIHKEDYFPHQWDFLKSKKKKSKGIKMYKTGGAWLEPGIAKID